MLRLLGALAAVALLTSLGPTRSGGPLRVAASAEPVAIRNGKLQVSGQPFVPRGVNYNPTLPESYQLDTTAPASDVPRIAGMGFNTIGTYHLGPAEYYGAMDLPDGMAFYDALWPAAEAQNLKIIVAYWTGPFFDWTDDTEVARVTLSFQEVILRAKDRPSTLLYLIGNEVFEKLPNDSQRVAYARWIGQMADWVHDVDPAHPITYADPYDRPGLPYLRAYAPNLDFYAINNYRWQTTDELRAIITTAAADWPGKPIPLHEFGSESWDARGDREDTPRQETRLQYLHSVIAAVVEELPLLGALLFEFSEEPRLVGAAQFTCRTCFDGVADEAYWGLGRASPMGQASLRSMKVREPLRPYPLESPTATPTNTSPATPTATSAGTAAPTPTPAATATATATWSPTVTATTMPSATASRTATATSNATATSSPTAAVSAATTPTPTATGPASPTPTPSPMPTSTSTAISAGSNSSTETATATATTLSLTATPSQTDSSSSTSLPTPTATPHPTETPTGTSGPSAAPARGETGSPTATATPSATAMATATLTEMATARPTGMATPTATPTDSPTPIETATATATATPTESTVSTATAAATSTPTEVPTAMPSPPPEPASSSGPGAQQPYRLQLPIVARQRWPE